MLELGWLLFATAPMPRIVRWSRRFRPPAAILADAISFAVSAVCVWWIRMPELAPRPTHGGLMWSDIVEGVRVVIRDPILRATTQASMTWNLFSGGLLDAIYVLYLSGDLQFAPGQVATLFVMPLALAVPRAGFGSWPRSPSTTRPPTNCWTERWPGSTRKR